MTTELHFLDRGLWRHARNWIEGILFALALVCLYALVQTWDEATKLRGEVAQLKTVACPTELDGRTFRFSAYEQINITRPGYAQLTCFYKREKQS